MPVEAELSTSGVTVRYGGVTANDSVDIEVRAGEITGLIGPNGAGKTTFLDALSGFAPATGSVRLAGEPIDGDPPHIRRRKGLARTWQAGEMFESLTVIESLLVAERPVGFTSLLRDLLPSRHPDRTAAMSVLASLGLNEVADRSPMELSLGTQRLIGVARALAGTSRVLLLDEPAAGLDVHESVNLGDRLSALTATGRGVLLVDHDMDLVFRICHRVYVLDFGRLIAVGSPSEVRSSAVVRNAYLGSAAVDGL